jgi:hypothetical protein
MKNEVDTYGATVFAPDYSATIVAADTCTNSDEHSMYIRILWNPPIGTATFCFNYRFLEHIQPLAFNDLKNLEVLECQVSKFLTRFFVNEFRTNKLMRLYPTRIFILI